MHTVALVHKGLDVGVGANAQQNDPVEWFLI